MVARSYTSPKHGHMFYMIILGLVSATLYGCLAMSTIEKVAKGEPTVIRFVLSAGADAYEITRWWDFGQETLSVLRHDLPIGCDTARFFLNDSAQELQIAQPTTVSWVTGVSPPLPDESYPPCALLVSYGSFTGPPALEGLAVTSAGGLVAISERKQPHPAVGPFSGGNCCGFLYFNWGCGDHACVGAHSSIVGI